MSISSRCIMCEHTTKTLFMAFDIFVTSLLICFTVQTKVSNACHDKNLSPPRARQIPNFLSFNATWRLLLINGKSPSGTKH